MRVVALYWVLGLGFTPNFTWKTDETDESGLASGKTAGPHNIVNRQMNPNALPESLSSTSRTLQAARRFTGN